MARSLIFRYRWVSLALAFLTVCLLVLGAGVAILVLPALPDPEPEFVARKGTLVAVHELGRTSVGKATVIESRLVSSSGLEVVVAVRKPPGSALPRPAVVLLAGLRTGHRAVLLSEQDSDCPIAALSYPYNGDPRAKGLELVMQLPQMQRAILDTPPAVMLAMDYLAQQPYVDRRRVELVGGSLGAFLVSVPGALDTRFSRVWLIHGAGDPRAVFEQRMQRYIEWPWLRALTARLLALISVSHHLRPEKWVGRIAPRPVVVINARDDEMLPRASVEALHRALGPSAEVIWTEGSHVTPSRTQVVEQLVALVLDRACSDPPTGRK